MNIGNIRRLIVGLAAAVVAMMLFDWLQRGWLFVIQSWGHYVAGFVGGFILRDRTSGIHALALDPENTAVA